MRNTIDRRKTIKIGYLVTLIGILLIIFSLTVILIGIYDEMSLINNYGQEKFIHDKIINQ